MHPQKRKIKEKDSQSTEKEVTKKLLKNNNNNDMKWYEKTADKVSELPCTFWF